MSYQVLARKWRPKCFADLVGQEHVVRALHNALKEQRLHHAYLLTGTRGVGKTTIARILAKSLNCEAGIAVDPCCECSACHQIDSGRFVDLLEIDAASNTGIDNIREVLGNAQYAPTSGRFKVYIIDEVHMLSKSAFNAMLKTLEEPPSHVKFILATTDPQKVPLTVLSRCLQFSLRNMTPNQVAAHLAQILNVEGVAYQASALALLGRAAAGSMRDAQSLLDQAIAYGLGEVKEEGVRAMLGAVDRCYLFELLHALAAGDGPRLMAKADGLAQCGVSFDSVLSELAVLLQQLALMQTVPQVIAEDEPEYKTLQDLAGAISPQDMQMYYQIAIHGRRDLSLAPDEHAGFNMTLLRMLAFYPSNTEDDIELNRPEPSISNRPSQKKNLTLSAGALKSSNLIAIGSPRSVQVTMEAGSPKTGNAPAVSVSAVCPPVLTHQVGLAVAPKSGSRCDTSDDHSVSPVDASRVQRMSALEKMLPNMQTPPAVSLAYRFDGDWKALVTELGIKLGAARMLACNAVLKEWDDNRLILAVQEKFQHMAGVDYQNKLKLVLCEYFGRSVELLVTVEELGRETPAMEAARISQKHLDIARQSIMNDSLVQRMVREFDATLLIETIKIATE